jgi:hypothetical protein
VLFMASPTPLPPPPYRKVVLCLGLSLRHSEAAGQLTYLPIHALIHSPSLSPHRPDSSSARTLPPTQNPTHPALAPFPRSSTPPNYSTWAGHPDRSSAASLLLLRLLLSPPAPSSSSTTRSLASPDRNQSRTRRARLRTSAPPNRVCRTAAGSRGRRSSARGG